MAPRKAVPKELTRETIMDAARDLFIKKGYQHVSMRQIAKKLNYSHGAIYYHFKNKAELFYALVEKHFHMLDETLDRIMAQPLDSQEKLKQVLLGFIEFGLTHQSYYEMMFLTKDEEVIQFINHGPVNSFDKFATSVASLSDKEISLQEVWSLFLSLHGFVTHNIRYVNSYEEVKEAALLHVNFLLKVIT